MSEEAGETLHSRHYTRDEANALLPRLRELLQELQDAKENLTDEQAHQLLSDAAPSNGGGEPGLQVGVGFLEVRRLLETLEEADIVIRDIDKGLLDFPAIIDGREVFLCWELGEDEVAYWHDLDSGYGGRQALD